MTTFKSKIKMSFGYIGGLLALGMAMQAEARPLNAGLDAESRLAIQQAKMVKSGITVPQEELRQPVEVSNSFQGARDRMGAIKPVEISNTSTGRLGHPPEKRCEVRVGNVTSNVTSKGTRLQNVVVVDGGIVNVCQ